MKDFIMGIIFAIVGLPILDTIATLIVSAGEVIKGKCALKVSYINEKISKIGGKESTISAIGFVAPEEKDDQYED